MNETRFIFDVNGQIKEAKLLRTGYNSFELEYNLFGKTVKCIRDHSNVYETKEEAEKKIKR